MISVLVKKQLSETLAAFTRSKNNKKARSKFGLFLIGVLYLICLFSFGVMFFFTADSLAEVYILLDLKWLYFTYFALLSIVIGLLGSAFTTYTSLYKAKDNEMLLSMPIRPDDILIARILVVWIWSLIYELPVFGAALIAYYMHTGSFVLTELIGQLGLGLATSLLTLVLSCILGYAVAKISVKFRGKSIITVLISFVGILIYYIVYYQASKIINSLLENALTIGKVFKEDVYPLYVIGSAGEGNLASMMLYLGITIILVAIMLKVMSGSFIKLATTNRGEKKVAVKNYGAPARSVSGAVFFKERSKFTSSAGYMLNCSIAPLFILVAGVMGIIFRDKLNAMLAAMPEGFTSYIPLIICGGLCLLASTCDISAPSISVEGKTIWLLQSLPVDPFTILMQKLKLHVIVSYVPTAIVAVEACVLFGLEPAFWVLSVVLPFLFILFTGTLGLFLNLKFPNLDWSNEMVAIKQGASVGLTLFGGMAMLGVLAGLYFLVGSSLSTVLYLVLCSTVLLLLDALLLLWLKKKGAKRYSTL